MIEQRAERLPYGVGRLTALWWLLVAAVAAVLAFGLYAYHHQFTRGDVVLGLRDIGTGLGATWGLYVAFVVYFIGVSFSGIILAAVIRLLDLRQLRPIARMAEVLTVITIVLGALSIIADLGNPLRALVNLPRYARPESPMFGTFTLTVSGYLFSSLVYLYLDSRRDAALCARVPGRLQRLHRWWAAGYTDTPAERERHRRATFWLSVAILPLLVVAHSTLGFIFGLQIGRPGWHSALQAPGFVLLAGVSGMGLLIMIVAAVRRALGEQQRIGLDVFRWLNNFLLVLILAYLYFWVVETLSSVYQGNEVEVDVTKSLFSGTYAPIFWASLGLLVVAVPLLVWQYFVPRYAVWAGVAAGVLVNLASIGKRFVLVVPSQTRGTLLRYGEGTYWPTWVEYGVVLGLFALGTLLFVGFVKLFPIMDVEEES